MEDFQHHVLECSTPTTDASENDDRVCPMCSEIFPNTVPQREFETHVNEHFEEEEAPATLVNEFEVVRP